MYFKKQAIFIKMIKCFREKNDVRNEPISFGLFIVVSTSQKSLSPFLTTHFSPCE